MSDLGKKTIREIAVEMPASIPVFESHRIDYCCGGDVTFEEACNAADVTSVSVEEAIRKAVERSREREDTAPLDGLTAPELIRLIVRRHHTFTTDAISRLQPLMDKVLRKHGENHPELKELHRDLSALCAELGPHMYKEEKVLFPYIEELTAADDEGRPPGTPMFGTVENPVRMMRFEHEAAGKLLLGMRQTTNDFTLPEDGCASFQALYFGIEELEKDLHRHIHIENNLLFPMAVELEEAARK